MQSLELRIPPPVIALIAAGAMWLLARSMPELAVANPWRAAMALICAVAGILIGAAGIIAFRRARTTVNPLQPQTASAIVTSGIYRRTRNPMYLGSLLLLIGWGLWLSHPPALLLVPAFMLYMNRFQIAPEERALRAKFGAAYEDYLREVRRWV